MNITEDLIKDKAIVGTSSDGNPIVMIETKGGLFALFTKTDNGQIDTLATAAHKAIAAWLAEKKDSGIKWKKDFHKSENELSKGHTRTFTILYSALFSGANNLEKNINSDAFIVYDAGTKVIGLMTAEAVCEGVLAGEIKKHCIVRDTACKLSVSRIEYHPVFCNLFK